MDLYWWLLFSVFFWLPCFYIISAYVTAHILLIHLLCSKEVSDIVVNKVAMDGDSNNEPESRSLYEPDHNVSFSPEGSKQRLRIEDRKNYKRTSSLCLNLNSHPPSQAIKPKQHAVARNPRRSGGKNKLGSNLNRSCKVTRPSNKHVSSSHDLKTTQQLNMNSIVSRGRRTRKGACSSSYSLYVDQDESCGTVMPVDISNHINNWDCRDPHIP